MMVFHDADSQAQFNWDTGLAFADPFGVGLEQGQDFFVMGNGFALNSAASNLIDLTFGMQAKGAQVCEQHFRYLKVVFFLTSIEVEQSVTRLPPHRSQRAELPHKALQNCSLAHVTD